jgi:hypothetical protein
MYRTYPTKLPWRPCVSGVSDIAAFDDERFSWKGSFESALASDSRTRLSMEAKR